MTSGIVIVALSLSVFKSRSERLVILGSLVVLAVIVESLRLVWTPMNVFVGKYFGALMREGEQRRFSGTVSYILGCWLSFLVFPPEIAVLAILFLAIGDPIASMVGVRMGKRKLPFSSVDGSTKTWEGGVACGSVCALLAFVAVTLFPTYAFLSWPQRLAFGVLGGLAGTLGEILPLRTDDNLSMPLVAGGLLWFSGSFLNLIPGLYQL